jgi:beta-lactamase class A
VTQASILFRLTRALGPLALAAALAAPATAAHAAGSSDFESAFDRSFSVEQRTAQRTAANQRVLPQTAVPFAPAIQRPVVQRITAPTSVAQAPVVYGDSFEAQLARLANGSQGRIGVAAIDLASGRTLSVLGDQPFPMASTSKVAIAATFLEMVDNGRARLTDKYPLMVPMPSRKFDGPVAPVRPGELMTAEQLINLALTRSSNPATDALLAAVGGTRAVNDWLRRTGNAGMRIDRDIATLVRDDGAVNPATTIDVRDSATPNAMVRLLSGLYQGRWLSSGSRAFLLQTMERCQTGKRRIPGLMPEGLVIAHKTGTLSNTASDIGIVNMPDGRAIAMAIYVTGQGGKPNRDGRIAEIARAIYDGYQYRGTGMASAGARK